MSKATSAFLLGTSPGVLITAVAGNAATWLAWAAVQAVLPESAGSMLDALTMRIPVSYAAGAVVVGILLAGILIERRYVVRQKVAEAEAARLAAGLSIAEQRRSELEEQVRELSRTPRDNEPKPRLQLAYRIAAVVNDFENRSATCRLEDIVRQVKTDANASESVEELVGFLISVGVLTSPPPFVTWPPSDGG